MWETGKVKTRMSYTKIKQLCARNTHRSGKLLLHKLWVSQMGMFVILWPGHTRSTQGHTRDPRKCSSVSVPDLCWSADQFCVHLESLTLTLPLTPSVMCGSIMWCMYAWNQPAGTHWALTPGYGSMSILSMSDSVYGGSVSILLFFVSVLVSVGCKGSIVWCRHGGCSGSGHDK